MDKERTNIGHTRLEKHRGIRYRKRIIFMGSILSGIFLFVLIISFQNVTHDPVNAVSAAWNGTTANSFAGGNGSENDPYRITTAEQLAYFSQQVNAGTTYSGKFINLTQDILLNEMKPNGSFVSGNPREFTRIGHNTRRFAGNFNGGGYEIIGLYINKGNDNYTGLFGYADTGSAIRKLKISGNISGGDRTGAVAGFTNGLITECIVQVPISVNWNDYHGGVAGEAGVNSVISSCSVKSDVAGTKYVGGIVGYTSGKVTDSSADKAISGQTYIGGIAGIAFGTGSEISNSTFTGTATANANYIGGIAGQAEGLITGITVDATITGQGYVGGIVGYAPGVGSKISSASFKGTAKANGDKLGGIAGQSEGHIEDCTVSGSIIGQSGYVGGIVGWAFGPGSVVTNCTFIGAAALAATVTGNSSYLGGIAGRADGVITFSTVDAAITGQSGYVGGIAGSSSAGSVISNTSVGGSVSGKSGGIGGIVGQTDGTVKISINTGTVQSNSGNTGGIAGEAGNNAVISNSFNSGEIKNNGGHYYGGIVGNAANNTQIHHNLNMGVVGGTQNVGGITGNTPGTGNTWNNYYNNQATPKGTNGGDITNVDGAVPIGNMAWEDIQKLLNLNNEDGGNIWTPDLDDSGVPKPNTGPEPKHTVFTSAMKEGKFYTKVALGSGTAVSVTSDSVFTVSFSLTYAAACEPKDHTLSFVDNGVATELPTGTSITMLAEGSYYYMNLTAPKSVITLGDFVKMGTADLRYNPVSIGAGVTKDYLFVVDFTNGLADRLLPAKLYRVKLDTPAVGISGELPSVTITGKNNYTLTLGSGVNSFTIRLAKTPVNGYDYKTDGRALVYKFYLEKSTGNGTETIALPIGTKINGVSVSSALPYAFVPVDLGNTSAINLDMSGSVDPIPSGTYGLHVIAYSCTDITKPQDGYVLVRSRADLTIASPIAYAMKAYAQTRLLDPSSAPISVNFYIKTQGSSIVKSKLQKKIGESYVDIDGQVNLPVTIAGESAILMLPADSPKGTYRFLLKLFDANGVERAKDVANVIIK